MTFYSSLPSKKENWWQIDIIPTISILRMNHLKNIDNDDLLCYEHLPDEKRKAKYFSICIGWLCWQIGFIIYK